MKENIRKCGKIVEIAAVFVKNQVGQMSLGVEEPGVEEGQEAVSKVTIGEWIMDYDEPTFCSTWL